MKRRLLAKALGRGVEAAVQITFSEAQELLESGESLSEEVLGDDGTCATYEILAVQSLDDERGAMIELRVLSSDGERQAKTYIYARADGLEAST